MNDIWGLIGSWGRSLQVVLIEGPEPLSQARKVAPDMYLLARPFAIGCIMALLALWSLQLFVFAAGSDGRLSMADMMANPLLNPLMHVFLVLAGLTALGAWDWLVCRWWPVQQPMFWCVLVDGKSWLLPIVLVWGFSEFAYVLSYGMWRGLAPHEAYLAADTVLYLTDLFWLFILLHYNLKQLALDSGVERRRLLGGYALWAAVCLPLAYGWMG